MHETCEGSLPSQPQDLLGWMGHGTEDGSVAQPLQIAEGTANTHPPGLTLKPNEHAKKIPFARWHWVIDPRTRGCASAIN